MRTEDEIIKLREICRAVEGYRSKLFDTEDCAVVSAVLDWVLGD